MRIHQFAAGLALVMAFATGAAAQDTTTSPQPEKKPGGLNKIAHDVSHASKVAGRQLKAGLKSTSSDAHQVLKKAGNDTKAQAKRTTGYTTPAPTPDHKPGGLNKLARDVSHASKKTGAKVKHEVKHGASDAHGALTDAGKTAKDTLKTIKPPRR